MSVNPNCGACGHMNTQGFCNVTACIYPCPTGMGGYINKPQTSADRIRAMTDEELANFLMDVASRGGIQTESGIARWTLIDWLKQGVAE